MGMIKRNTTPAEIPDAEKSILPIKAKPVWGEKLTRNVFAAALLLCCAIGARDVMLTPDKTVLDALQTAVKSEWDENLGRLMYVNGSLSDAIAVFSSSTHAALYQPSNGIVSDVFSAASPYIVYSNAGTVYAAADGEILSITAANDQSYTVRMRCGNNTECLYYGLNSCTVNEGDTVQARAELGDCKQDSLYFEVRKNGAPIDASSLFISTARE